MTRGEEQLRQFFGVAIYATESRVDVIDHLIAAIKRGNYFVHCGEILEVTWDNPVDWEDGKISYSLIAEDPDPDPEEDED